MKRAAALFVVLVLAGSCGTRTIDPCVGVTSACLAVHLDRGSVTHLDRADLDISSNGGITHRSVMPAGGKAAELPMAVGVVFDQLDASPTAVHVDITAWLGGNVAGHAPVDDTLAAGQHHAVHVQLSAGSAPPQLAFDQDHYDLGTVLVGMSSASVQLMLTNTGGRSATLSLHFDGGELVAGPDDCSGQPLDAGASCTVSVHAAPTAAGSVSGVLTASDGAATASVALSYLAAAPGNIAIDPPTKDYGSVGFGDGMSQTFVVSNHGGSTSSALSISISGTGASQFAKMNDGCSGVALMPSASCNVSIAFQPTVAGGAAASLTASATMGGTGVTTLSGVGVPPDLAMPPPDLTFVPDLALLPFGASCTTNSQCQSGICGMFEMGALFVCTKPCTPATQATDCPNPPSTGTCNSMNYCKF
jgi:hypothetical protein